MWSEECVKCNVWWSVECGVYKCGMWSVKCVKLNSSQ